MFAVIVNKAEILSKMQGKPQNVHLLLIEKNEQTEKKKSFGFIHFVIHRIFISEILKIGILRKENPIRNRRRSLR